MLKMKPRPKDHPHQFVRKTAATVVDTTDMSVGSAYTILIEKLKGSKLTTKWGKIFCTQMSCNQEQRFPWKF